MLKSLRNLSDEEVVVFWSENPYAQDFCVERELQWGPRPSATPTPTGSSPAAPAGIKNIPQRHQDADESRNRMPQ